MFVEHVKLCLLFCRVILNLLRLVNDHNMSSVVSSVRFAVHATIDSFVSRMVGSIAIAVSFVDSDSKVDST